MTVSDVAPLRNLMAPLVCDVLKCVNIAGPCQPPPCKSGDVESGISALGSRRKAGNMVPDLSLSIARQKGLVLSFSNSHGNQGADKLIYYKL